MNYAKVALHLKVKSSQVCKENVLIKNSKSLDSAVKLHVSKREICLKDVQKSSKCEYK